MFAIIRTGGKQYRVAEQELIKVDKLAGQPGDVVEFGEVLLIGGESVSVGSPIVSGAKVSGEVVEQGRDNKVVAFKKRRRKNSRRKRGHRQEFSLIRITEILTEGRKPKAKSAAAAAPRAEAAPVAQPAGAEEAPVARPETTQAAPASAAPETAPAEAKPRARKPAAQPAAEAEAAPAAEPSEQKPAKTKAAAKPKKEAAAPKAEKNQAAPAKKPAAKKPAGNKSKDQKK